MSYQNIALSFIESSIAHISLHRPEKRNALSKEMIEELHHALDFLSQHEPVRALIISGEGKAFAAGADIAELKERTRNDAFLGINSRLFTKLENFSWPTIAAIEGFAFGGGCELALACDLRVAGKSAKLGQPEVNLGIVAGAGATYRLARLVGLGRARDLLFTGRALSAEEAFHIGLIEYLTEAGEALQKSISIATLISQKAPLAIRLTKSLLNSYARNLSGEGPLLAEISQAVLFETEDKREGMSAFLEKREPSFHNK